MFCVHLCFISTSFSWLNDISLYVYTTFCLSIRPLMNMDECLSIHPLMNIHCIYSSLSGDLGFHDLTIVNSAAVSSFHLLFIAHSAAINSHVRIFN